MRLTGRSYTFIFTSMAQHLVVGKEGEAIAKAFLLSLGYDIRAANVRIARDEIDLIAYDPQDDVLVFAEVKTRSRFDNDFLPELDLTAHKRRKLWRSARAWIANEEYDDGYRIDVVCVAAGRVLHHFKEIDGEDD